MAHVQHPRVTRDRMHVRVELPDPRRRRVLVVWTDVPMSPQDAGFDQEEFESLTEAVREAMERLGADEAEIVSPSDPRA